jgi:hypothetical protein
VERVEIWEVVRFRDLKNCRIGVWKGCYAMDSRTRGFSGEFLYFFSSFIFG